MSYDLQVYARRALDAEQLRTVVLEAGLEVGEGRTVVRGAASRYCCTVEEPAGIEPEDVPEGVVGLVLAPTVLYEVLVEGSSAVEVPHAVRLARRLAQAAEGVVLDQQTGQTWSRGGLRTWSRPPAGDIDVVQLRWYAPAAADAGRAWVDVARSVLPEALPRRFGSTEPLAGSLARDGEAAFVQAVADGDLVFIRGTAPCLEGTVAGPDPGPFRTPRPVVAHGLILPRDAMEDADWRATVQQFFVQVAGRTRAVFASAEVLRGHGWTGRSLYSGGEMGAYLSPRREWTGLPPYPVWWAWFGPAYVPLVAGHLPAGQVQRVGGGLLHVREEEPLDRDRLLEQVGARPAPPRRWLRRGLGRGLGRGLPPGDGWLPASLLAAYETPGAYGAPAERAAVLPRRLG